MSKVAKESIITQSNSAEENVMIAKVEEKQQECQ